MSGDAAREAILAALADGAGDTEADRASVLRQAQDLLAAPDAARPARTGADVVTAFVDRVNGPKVAASAERIGALDAVPAAVGRFLHDRARPPAVRVQPAAALLALNWAGAGIATDADPDDGVAVGLARWGIAETGSVVVHSGADTPVLLSFLPAVSIVVVSAGRLLWYLEDYAAAARQAGDPAPRNACLITGASGTTDIEGRLVTGAHGPGELHVVVVDDGAAG